MSTDTSPSQAQPQTQQHLPQESSRSPPNRHPGIAQTTSAPAVPTVSSPPTPQQTHTQPPSQQTQESSGMSMSALLSKLSQTASPAPANAISQPFPGGPTSGPGSGFQHPSMNGGQHLYPGNGAVPDMLHHSNSWSVGQIPSPHPHHMGGTASPHRAPAYPHQMGGVSSPQPPHHLPPPHHAVDLTASLKQMLGLGASASPNRVLSDSNGNHAMTPGAQRNGPVQHPMTPTRRLDDPQSFHLAATPPPIHLAPALNTTSSRSHSPLQTPSLQQSTLSGNVSQPPSRQLSQRQVQTNSPHNSFASPANAQSRRPNQGYVPNPSRNGDPFTIGASNGNIGAHTIDTNGVTHAVVNTWNNNAQKDGLTENENAPPDEDDKDQKRDFVRALLSAIHVSLAPFNRNIGVDR
ncbi:hypothetical protein QFC22_006280 [Naganishia vaughanmartiniae]|uniref:Uncharacterized protein n=1 Tax=Naganishia vaughanmartiniae TaxID=1424756 RepID=A0ACC2WLA9_9TREE|nr:hypothetical protein QFC22_006280 [Naganishia vaughanmartiniae]